MRLTTILLLGLDQEVRASARAPRPATRSRSRPRCSRRSTPTPRPKGIYEPLAFTHRKEFARWVAEAKKDETRDRRVVQTLEMLRAGRTRS